jgi:hypothetical protein
MRSPQNRSTLDPQTDPRSVCFSVPECKRLHGIIERVVGSDKMSLVPGKVNLAIRILSDPCGRGGRGRARSQRNDRSLSSLIEHTFFIALLP